MGSTKLHFNTYLLCVLYAVFTKKKIIHISPPFKYQVRALEHHPDSCVLLRSGYRISGIIVGHLFVTNHYTNEKHEGHTCMSAFFSTFVGAPSGILILGALFTCSPVYISRCSVPVEDYFLCVFFFFAHQLTCGSIHPYHPYRCTIHSPHLKALMRTVP